MKNIVVLAVLIILSCSTIGSQSIREYNGYSMNVEFIDYIINFERICNIKVKSRIYFAHYLLGENIIGVGEGDVIGQCWPFIYTTIFIKKEWWDQASHLEREQLLFHELGHCVLGRIHTEEVIPLLQDCKYPSTRMPKSIMYPELISTYYEEFHEYYMDELCGDRMEKNR